jgi:uncharacterized membrane protein (Fun14 family)
VIETLGILGILGLGVVIGMVATWAMICALVCWHVSRK